MTDFASLRSQILSLRDAYLAFAKFPTHPNRPSYFRLHCILNKDDPLDHLGVAREGLSLDDLKPAESAHQDMNIKSAYATLQAQTETVSQSVSALNHRLIGSPVFAENARTYFRLQMDAFGTLNFLLNVPLVGFNPVDFRYGDKQTTKIEDDQQWNELAKRFFRLTNAPKPSTRWRVMNENMVVSPAFCATNKEHALTLIPDLFVDQGTFQLLQHH